MEESRGITTRGGPGVLSRNLGGQIITEALPSTRPTGVAIRPLQVIGIKAQPTPTVRVVLGGILSDTFWYADADMDAQENGTIDHPYFKITDVADGDSIYIKLTVSTDGTFWRIDSSDIEKAAVVPTPDATHAYLLLNVVSVVDGDAVPNSPQTIVGNRAWERAGIPSSFLDRWDMADE